MNKVVLMGRLPRDPTIKYFEKGIAIGNFSLAVTRNVKNNGKEEVDYLNCTIFNKQAVFLDKYVKQGSKILISGRIENNNYAGKSGQFYSIKVIVEEIEFAEKKSKPL